MKFQHLMRNLAIILILSFIVGTVGGYERQTVSAQEQEENMDFTMQTVIDRFAVTESFVQHQLDAGYTLSQVYSALFKAELESISYEEAVQAMYPAEVNVSSTVTGSVYDDLIDPVFRNTTVVDLSESSVAGNVYDPDAAVTDSVYEEDFSAGKNSASGKDNLMAMQALADTPAPVMEKPPVYSKTSMNEAPYSVGGNNESISSLSGSLSLNQADMTLPGRNGLSFALTRQYDSNDSQFYEPEFGANYYNQGVYKYYVQFNATRKQLLTQYHVRYVEKTWVQEDNNGDGIPDLNTEVMREEIKTKGTYADQAQANQIKAAGISYTIPADSRTETAKKTSTTNNFANTYILYNQNGYSGTLYPTGSATAISGSETFAASRIEKAECYNSISGKYNSNGVWQATSSGVDCPDYKIYDSGGFKGALYRLSGAPDIIKSCPINGTKNYVCTKQFRANYSGTVTKPGSDTRTWEQNYRGTVTKPSYVSNTNFSGWMPNGSKRWRYAYAPKGDLYVDIELYEGAGREVPQTTDLFESSTDATQFRNTVNSSTGIHYKSEGGYNYYISYAPQATVMSYQVGSYTTVSYFNDISKPLNEQWYPIGKGWSWRLPHVVTANNKQYFYPADGGRYEVVGNTIKGMDWEGLSFATDTTVQVNGETSQYVIISVDGTMKQHFTTDGRLIRISDAYGNTLQFLYAQNATYGRKLLSQVKDAIGNTITISYSASEVVVTKGNQSVTYQKRKDAASGIELLDSVTDTEGRKTSYSYLLSEAKFNLMGAYPERARSNPYALLTSVQHPTGALSEYTYEPNAVTRYLGESSTNQAYRVLERRDKLTYENGTTEIFNRQSMFYTNDFSGPYGQDMSFSTQIDFGLTQTTFSYKKDYIDEATGAKYYLEQQLEKGGTLQKTTAYTYGKNVGSRSYPVPVPTKTVLSDNMSNSTLITSAQYDDYGNVLQATDAAGLTTTYGYDSVKKWKVSETKPVDTGAFLYTSFGRNSQGDVIETTIRKNNASGEVIQQVNDKNIDVYGNVTLRTISYGDKTLQMTVAYDSAYQFAFPTSQGVTVTDASNLKSTIVTKAEYDLGTGMMIASTDGKNARTTYQYDKLGRIKQVTHPDGKLLRAAYNDVRNTLLVTDEGGYQTQKIWNGLGWEVESGIINQAGYEMKAKNDYDAFGRVEWSEDALGNRSRYEFDNWKRLTKTVLPNGSETTVSYDDRLHKKIVTDPLGYKDIETYDKFGRLEIAEEQAQGTGIIATLIKNVYHPVNGQIVLQLDAKQQATTFTYTMMGQLASTMNAKNEETRYEYDLAGNMTKTIFPDANVQTKDYDELGRLIRSTDAQQKSDTFYYDANGNRSKMVDKQGQVVQFTYSSRNLLLSKQGTNETISFTYTDNGSRKTMTDNTGTTIYSYEPFTAKLNSVVYPDGKKLVYAYDAQGELSSLTTPFGDVASYSYNNNNQLTNVSWNNLVQESYSYHVDSRIAKEKQANGLLMEYSYSDLKLTNLKQLKKDDGIISNYNYQYDVSRNIIGINEQSYDKPEIDNLFTYDVLNRIETATSFNESYSYDKRGNRKTLLSDSKVKVTDNIAYEYDEWDRLKKVVKADGQSVIYRYNGDNLMVERQQNGITTRYYYDGDQMIAEGTLQANGTVNEKVSYLIGNGLVMQEDAAGTKGYYSHNGHGDVVAIRDITGAMLNEYEYDIWGNTVQATEVIENSFRYSGEYWDELTDLQYLRARWYDPGMGSFVNEDTYEGQLDNPLTLNLYTYVNNNPLRYTDSSGHMPKNFLNMFLSKYITEGVTSRMTNAVIGSNGNSDSGRYIAFHEIAQIVAGQKISEHFGVNTTLEFHLEEEVAWWPNKHYWADIVTGDNQVWEVKPRRGAPLGGIDGYYEDAEAQLTKYQSINGNLTRGQQLESINGVEIIKAGRGDYTEYLKMNIEFYDEGKILYDFYVEDKDGNFKYALSTSKAEDYVEANYDYPINPLDFIKPPKGKK